MSTSVIISSIFFASDQLFRVEKLTVGASADLIWDGTLYLSILTVLYWLKLVSPI